MSARMHVETRLKVRPVPLLELRAQIAQELVVNAGGSETAGAIAAAGVLRRAWKEVHIDGLHPATGRLVDRLVYRIAWTGDHLQTVAVEDNTERSMIERCDEGLAELIRGAAERFNRKGLTIRTAYVWADDLSPERRDEIRRELGTEESTTPPWEDDTTQRKATLRPAKDMNSAIELWTSKKRS